MVRVNVRENDNAVIAEVFEEVGGLYYVSSNIVYISIDT